MTGETAAVVRLSQAAAAAVPPATVAMAKLCVLDWFGLALAGADEPPAAILREQALVEGAAPVASVPGFGRRFSVRQAALIGGVAGHALDYDDVSLAMHVHATTVILPAVLALAEARGLGGRAVIKAFVAGYEAAGMIGTWLGSAPYDRGFHMTGTLGALGAAMACAHLIGLDEEGCAGALGLAASQAAGLKAQFGTMAKPLHAGRAAEAGVQAALWAEAGMTARLDILEAAQGYAATQAGPVDGAIAWNGYELDRNLFKFHAACFGTHGTIEAIGALRRAGLRAQEVRSGSVKVFAGLDAMCNIAAPLSGTQAKFSLRFAAALALAGMDTADPALYDGALTTRPDLGELRAATMVELAPAGWPEDLTEVRVELHDGRTLVARHDTSISPPLSQVGPALHAKFRALLKSRLPTASRDLIVGRIGELETLETLLPLMSAVEFGRCPAEPESASACRGSSITVAGALRNDGATTLARCSTTLASSGAFEEAGCFAAGDRT